MYKILFLVLILAQFVFNLVLKVLSNKQIDKPLPASVRGIYNDEEYNKWRRYNGKKDKLGLAYSIVNLAINIALFGTNLVSVIYNAMPSDDVMVKAMLFILTIGLADTIISLPIDYIFTFKRECFGGGELIGNLLKN